MDYAISNLEKEIKNKNTFNLIKIINKFVLFFYNFNNLFLISYLFFYFNFLKEFNVNVFFDIYRKNNNLLVKNKINKVKEYYK